MSALKKRGCSQREVAEIIGTSQSTVSRELARNTGEPRYRHRQAQGRTDRRRTESARASRMWWNIEAKRLPLASYAEALVSIKQ
ncbi:MAG: helix-turn-helix domain-containing protein [Candidatus Endonucleobacter sp. (ex Gigantidas childressi)]|nr:helix-turn-helix domain-containing protein [Candidatus Endonucleobacter sp. (ex Gigantidas childressi)]